MKPGPSAFSTRMISAALVAAAAAAGCSNPMFETRPPKQSSTVHPTQDMARRGFTQRQRDCWDMPNAAACYEVGANYELGLGGPPDAAEALKYYDKACDLSGDDDHCDAAAKLRGDEN